MTKSGPKGSFSRIARVVVALLLALGLLLPLAVTALASPLSQISSAATAAPPFPAAQSALPLSAAPPEVSAWFAREGKNLAQALRGYLPKSQTGATIEELSIGRETQVMTWSNSYIEGGYTADTALQRVPLWIAPVTWAGIDVGVVTYTTATDRQKIFPRPLPSTTQSLAPRLTNATPQATTGNSAGTSTAVVEPRNSHLSVRSGPVGDLYVLPDLARELRLDEGDTPTRAVYDPVIKGWFALSDGGILLPASGLARARLAGTATLVQLEETVQSWWGVVEAVPLETPDVAETGIKPISIWVVTLVVAVIIGAGLWMFWLVLRTHSQERHLEVQPLPDPELVMVPSSSRTSAIPTLGSETEE